MKEFKIEMTAITTLMGDINRLRPEKSQEYLKEVRDFRYALQDKYWPIIRPAANRRDTQ